MRLLDGVIYVDTCGEAQLSAFNYPAVMVRGQTYTINVPLYWHFNREVPWGPGVVSWGENVYFCFGLRVLGGEPEHEAIHTFWALVEGLEDVREGSYVFPVELQVGVGVLNLTPGSYMLYLVAEAVALYPLPDVNLYGEIETEEIGFRVEISEGAPICSFVPSTTAGEAPLYVEFTDTSQAPSEWPIDSWLWDFGDGEISYQRDPVHVFSNPGTYIVTLTVSNQYGDDSASCIITVLAGLPRPVFSPDSWCPSAIDVDEAFTPVLIVDNQGGPGNIYLNYVIEGQARPLIDSLYVEGYTPSEIPMESHTIDWYLGYTPERSRYVDIMFQTGPVGQAPTGQFPVRITVYVEEEPPPPEGGVPWWPFAVGGVLVGGGLVAYAVTRKK